MLIRHKLSLDPNQIRLNMEDKHDLQSGEGQQELNIVNNVVQKEKLLPIIIKKHVSPSIPDQR